MPGIAARCILLAAACAGLVGAGSAGSVPPPISAASSAGFTPRQLCLARFSDDQLLSWARGAVADFRAYEYGGPTPTRPLATAFSSLPDTTAGAWCGTRLGSEATRWWAVVDGQQPVKAIDINGPGEGERRGEADGPPRVP